MPNKSWKIRDIVIDNQVVIAPMAGISNPAFRVICKQFGAGLIYTEMVSDKALYYDNEKNNWHDKCGKRRTSVNYADFWT